MRNADLPVPLLDLPAQYATIRAEIQAAVARVIESQQFILGPEVAALEEELAVYAGCAFGVGMSSGSDALLCSLMVLGIGPGDEVITTPFTFVATAGAIARPGATPVFVDIDPLTFNLDPGRVEDAITGQTRAILPVHLYGQMNEMAPLMALAKSCGLPVIEDAAQAVGAEYHGQRAGAVGQMGCLSFFPSKNLGAFGDGGMVLTNDLALAERLHLYRTHGFAPKYHSVVVGGNFRLDALQAAVLRVKLKYLDTWTAGRQRNAARYRRLFTEAGLVVEPGALDDGQPGLVLPVEAPKRRHVYHQFVIRCQRRDDLLRYLQRHSIGCAVYYPVPLHLQPCFASLGYRPGDFPASESAAQQVLALPIFPELTAGQITRVVDLITRFYRPG